MQKVTVTLPAEIVRALDAQARAAGGSRSTVLARVLDEWQRHAAQAPTPPSPSLSEAAARIDADTTAFYQAQTDDEREDDNSWATHTVQAAAAIWDAR